MTGPEHYLAAENLVARALKYPDSSDALVLVAAAQAHATLAHAAATAESNPEIAAYLPHDEKSVLPWLDVLISKTEKRRSS